MDTTLTMRVPESHRDLVDDSKRAFAVLATLMPDGTPQATPVWFDVEQGLVWVNTTRGRVKDANMGANPAVALAVLDPDNPYRYLQFRGRVVEETEQGAREHIDRLAHKYRGIDKYPSTDEQETRVIYKIQPTSIFAKS
jgi:PPOX class probable F420-dependent enzyme